MAKKLVMQLCELLSSPEDLSGAALLGGAAEAAALELVIELALEAIPRRMGCFAGAWCTGAWGLWSSSLRSALFDS